MRISTSLIATAALLAGITVANAQTRTAPDSGPPGTTTGPGSNPAGGATGEMRPPVSGPATSGAGAAERPPVGAPGSTQSQDNQAGGTNQVSVIRMGRPAAQKPIRDVKTRCMSTGSGTRVSLVAAFQAI